MNRLLVSISALAMGLTMSLGPAGAVGVSTPVATQENVRHLTTVPGHTGGHVVVEGNRLYMGNYGTGLSAYDISDVRNPVKIGHYLPGPSNSDGPDNGVRADAPPDAAFWDGKHVVSLGGTFRGANRVQTEFLDFTDPANPTLLHRFAGSNTGGGTHGESHNGDIVDARKLWLPSGGSGNDGLRIYDMSPLLQNPPAAPIRLGAWNPHTLWTQSRYKSAYNKPTGGAFNHTHDVEVYTDRRILLHKDDWVDQDEDGIADPTYGERDIALLAGALGTQGGAVYAIDITEPTEPVVISKWQNTTGNGIAYLHEAQFLDGDPNTIFVSDEDMTSGCEEGRVYFYNISDDLVDTSKRSDWTIGAGTQDAPLCAGAHVFSSHDRHVFMGAYVAGLQVIDARDPAQPKRAGRYIAEGQNSWGALYHKGVIYTGDFGARGLDVFEFIQEPTKKAFLKAGNPASRLAAVGGGVSEIVGACDPEAPTNDIDGMLVEIPADKADGTHMFRAMGSSSAPFDVDAYFWDKDCSYLGGILETGQEITGDLEGLIPEQAAFAYVDLFAGTPQWVYAKIS